MSSDSILIYDTTLRDGTQGEGVSFPVSAKIRIAERLDQFGVDYIEGGWPGSNPRDVAFFEEAKQRTWIHSKIVAFGSTCRAGVRASEDAQIALLIDAETPTVTIFGKTWLLHIEEILRTTAEENLRMIEDSVECLVSQGREVIYDAEHFFDGYKSNREYALKTLEAAVNGGASTLTLCDTNGGMMLKELQDIVSRVVQRFPKVRVGMHCHNDCGMGVALSLAGVEVGARMVQGTMNGFGERNGNANLTSIIPNLSEKMGLSLSSSANMPKLRDLSVFIDETANLRPDPRAAFVGSGAFAHKGGVHADAVGKVKSSYEHMEPERVGNSTRFLVSDMSGRSSLLLKAKELGIELDKSDVLKDFLEELKDREYRGYEYEAADASFKLLIHRFLKNRQPSFQLIQFRSTVGRQIALDRTVSEATVRVSIQGKEYHTVAEAHGPVSALDQALRKALAESFPFIDQVSLTDFKVRLLDDALGTDAITRVLIESTDDEETWGTVGASDNIIDASWQALRDSMEYKILLEEERSERTIAERRRTP